MFSYNGKDRPTIDEIKAHPWMNSGCDMKEIRSDIMNDLTEKRSAATTDTSRDNVVSRGDQMLDLVRETSCLELCKFNDMMDHDIDVDPGVVYDDLNTFNEEHLEGKMTIEKVEGKCLKLTMPDEDLVVKVKFFKASDAEENARTRVRFIRKRGDISKWYSMFKDMKDAVMDDILLAPPQTVETEA